MSDKFKGKKCIGWVRSNRGWDAIDNQVEKLRDFAKTHGLVMVDEIKIGGVGGVGSAFKQIDNLLRRKSQANDFQCLLIPSWDRLPRRWGLQALTDIEKFRAAGIEIVCADESDANRSDDFQGIHAQMTFRSMPAEAIAASRRILSARQRCITAGRMPISSKPAFGIDRLYIDEAGNELFIIRILSTQTQVQLHPKTHEVMRTFDAGKGYRKQAWERVVWVPGSKESIEVVRSIYRYKFVEKWSGPRIADHLNKSKCLSANGGRWSQITVHQASMNPIYLGIGIAHRCSTIRSLDPRVRSVIKSRRDFTNIVYRRQSDWIVVEHPRLRDVFVPLSHYEEIKKYQLQVMERNAEPEVDNV